MGKCEDTVDIWYGPTLKNDFFHFYFLFLHKLKSLKSFPLAVIVSLYYSYTVLMLLYCAVILCFVSHDEETTYNFI